MFQLINWLLFSWRFFLRLGVFIFFFFFFFFLEKKHQTEVKIYERTCDPCIYKCNIYINLQVQNLAEAFSIAVPFFTPLADVRSSFRTISDYFVTSAGSLLPVTRSSRGHLTSDGNPKISKFFSYFQPTPIPISIEKEKRKKRKKQKQCWRWPWLCLRRTTFVQLNHRKR